MPELLLLPPKMAEKIMSMKINPAMEEPRPDEPRFLYSSAVNLPSSREIITEVAESIPA